MAANANDMFQKVSRSTATTLSAPGYTIGATSINVASTSNWPADTGITFGIDEVDGNGNRIAGTYNIFRGTVGSATQLANLTYVGGDANRNYSAGATTRVYILVSYARENRLVDGLLVSHNQDGTLKTDSVDSTQIKANAITNPKLASGSVTADKTAFGADTHFVSSSETTTSATFTNLTTSGPTVTLTVPATGVVLVMMTATMFTNEANSAAVVGLSVSGANTIAPGDDIYNVSPAAGASATTTSSISKLLTGLNPGSTTFTMKYRRAGGVNATFGNRTLVVIPLS